MNGELDPGTGRRRRVAAFLILFAAFMIPATLAILGGGAAGAGTPPVALSVARSDLEAEGQLLYEEHCSSCHGADATGTAQGPDIVGLGPASYDFMMSTGRMPLAQPGAQAVRKEPTLSPAEIAAITAYLVARARERGPDPNVRPAAGSLSRGPAHLRAELRAVPRGDGQRWRGRPRGGAEPEARHTDADR